MSDRASSLSAVPGAIEGSDRVDPDALYDAICDRGNLTRRQLLIWAGDRAAAGEPVFAEAALFHIRGGLDATIFKRAFQAVLDESDALRMIIDEVDGEPRQRFLSSVTSTLEVVDLSLGAASAVALEELARHRAATCVGGTGPFIDAVLVRLGPEYHVWVLVQHQLASDAWSFGLVHQRLVEHYQRERRGQLAAAAARPQFHEYLAYEREFRMSPRGRKARAYWRSRYPSGSGGSAALAAGVGPERTRICRLSRPLGPAMTTALRKLAAVPWASPDLGLCGVFASLVVAHLHRTSDACEVVLSVPFANRPSQRFKRTVGSFMNVCPVRIGAEAGDSFQSLLARVDCELWEAARHQGYAGRQGVVPQPYDVLVNVHKETVAARTFGDLPMQVTWQPPTRRFGALAVAIEDFNAAGNLTLVLDFNEAIFGPRSREEISRSLLRLLERAVTSPERRLSELWPSPGEREDAVAVSCGATVWDRFAAQVAATPAAVAVRAEAEVVTYGALAARAAGVAAALTARGVTSQTIVAVWGERGVGLLSALLGIWRVGAVYLPVDPRWPAARVVQVLRQSGTRLVVTGPTMPAALQAAADAAVPWSVLSWETEGAPPTVSPAGDASDTGDASDAGVLGDTGDASGAAPSAPEDVAYVLYTSGSTGAPKGALITHAGLLNHLDAKIAVLGLGARDRVAQTAAAGFDISLWQYLAVLLVGGQVVVMAEAAVRDPQCFREAVAPAGVTVWETVPAVLGLVVEADVAAGEWRALAGLRWVVVTGEALAPALCRAWLARYPGIPLVNAYGPTECADDVTHEVVRTPPPAGAVRVPIGRPIAQLAVHVLDAALRPVEAGEEGELCVGGVGVGRGYLHEPARTAAAFVPDPFDGRPGARLYRTGDRGRRLPDGRLECLGRLDRQVKIRGMRIEPGEIEAVLLQHPAVRQAAVVARADAAATLRLVAYVAAVGSLPAPAATLRRFLGERLPDAMVPASFVFLAALPLSANGKIDRQALPEPAVLARISRQVDVPRAPSGCQIEAHVGASDVGGQLPLRASRSEGRVRLEMTGDWRSQQRAGEKCGPGDDPTPVSRAPETAVERLLAGIWGEVLRVDVRSVEDNFFTLGGDSLLSIRVVAQARRHGIFLTPAQLFEHQTIAGVAEVAATIDGPRAEQDLVIGDVEFTPVQRMLFDADLPDAHHYNMAVLLEVQADLVPSLLAIAVEHLLRHHDALRLRFRRDGEGWRQTIVGLDGVVPFSSVDLSGLADDALAAAITARATELQMSLDLADGPILRVASFDLGPERPGRLLIIVHHLACDVVSWPILLEDLASLYDQLGRGDPIALPAKTSSFQYWAQRLSEYGSEPARLQELEFWRRECAAPCARLPRDHCGGEAAVADVGHVEVVFEREEAERVRNLSVACGVSVEVVLLTALATAVTELAGGDALMVYLERHGREAVFPDLDVARTVGWFTAVFPVRLPVAASRRPDETLVLVARHLREIPRAGIGYGIMCYGRHRPKIAAALRGLPRPEVSFNYLGCIDSPGGVRWRRAPESAGPEVGRRGTRPTILDVTAQVTNGALGVDWAYDATLHRRATIVHLAGRFITIIREMLAAPRCETERTP